jgi:hypothetical protein
MSNQYDGAEQQEAAVPELELNKETLSDLDVDGGQVKGGAGIIAVAPQLTPARPNTGGIRAESLVQTGTSI